MFCCACPWPFRLPYSIRRVRKVTNDDFGDFPADRRLEKNVHIFERSISFILNCVSGKKDSTDILALKKAVAFLSCIVGDTEAENVLPGSIAQEAVTILEALDVESESLSSVDHKTALDAIESSIEDENYTGLFAVIKGLKSYPVLLELLKARYATKAKSESRLGSEASVLDMLKTMSTGKPSTLKQEQLQKFTGQCKDFIKAAGHSAAVAQICRLATCCVFRLAHTADPGSRLDRALPLGPVRPPPIGCSILHSRPSIVRFGQASARIVCRGTLVCM